MGHALCKRPPGPRAQKVAKVESAHSSSRAEAAPARRLWLEGAELRDKRAGESAGSTGEGPAGREQAEQTKERRMGGCGERNLSAVA